MTFLAYVFTGTITAKEALLSCNEKSEKCAEMGEWNLSLSVGVGLRTNPLSQSDDIPLIILPGFSYYSEHFFIENLDLGYSLYDSTQTSFNVIATPSYDSVFFNRWDPGNLLAELSSGLSSEQRLIDDSPVENDRTLTIPRALNKRKFGYLAGIEYSYQLENNLFQLSLLTDISTHHSGKEARFAYAYSLHQIFTTTIGFTWKDTNLTNYYYGVDPNEVVDDRATYETQASFSPFLRLSLNRPTDNQNNWKFSLEYQKLSSQISKSPLLENNNVVTFFAGKRFKF